MVRAIASEGIVKRTVLIAGAAALLVVGGGVALWRAADAQADAALETARVALQARGLALAWGEAGLAGFPLDPHLLLEDAVLTHDDGWAVEAAWIEARDDGGALRATVAPEGALVLSGGRAAAQTVNLALEADPAAGAAVASAEAVTLQFSDGARLSIAGAEARATAEDATLTASIARASLPGDRAELALTGLSARGEGAATRAAAQGLILRVGGAEALTTGPATLEAAAGGDRLTLAFEAERPALDARFATRLGGVTAATLSASADLPVTAAETAQGYAATLDLTRIEPAPAVLEALAAAGAPTDAPATLSARLSGEALLRVNLLDPAPGPPPQPPVRVLTLAVDAFEAQGLGATADLTGVLVLKPDRSAPDGELLARVEDWAMALGALSEAGLLTPAEAERAIAIIDRLEDPEAPSGVFRSRIALRGGAVYANGRRVR